MRSRPGLPSAGMLDLLKLLGGFAVGLFRFQAAREAEMTFLRQQLLVLKWSAPARSQKLRVADRLIFVGVDPAVPVGARSCGNLPARDAGTLELAWLPPALALEVRLPRRPAAIPAEICNLVRAHLALDKDAPLRRPPQTVGETRINPMNSWRPPLSIHSDGVIGSRSRSKS